MQKTTRLLIVDDDRDDFVVVRDMLTGLPERRYETDWAATPDEGIEAMFRKAYDVCLVDYYMGASTGIEFIQLASERGFSIPMIVLTGQASPAADLAAQGAGAVEFIDKNDLTVRLLDRSIRYVLERADTISCLRDSTRFMRSILDSVSVQMAIIEESGEINFVNRPWTEFAEANGLGEQRWKGVNYLEVCDRAGAAGDETAGEVAQAIRDVLQQRWSSFSVEYPCHNGEKRGWFRVKITRFEHRQTSWAVVAHYDITDQKLAETSKA